MYFVASRSLLSICDHKITNPESESQKTPLTYPSRKGETIYCHPTAIRNFISKYLPNIKFPFILVSGDSDTTVPEDIRNEANYLLNHPLLICWFSQNCTEPSEKLKQLPIGLYNHVMFNSINGWSPLKKNDITHFEDMMIKLKDNPKKNKCFSNFHFFTNTRYGKDRTDAINLIPKDLVDYQSIQVSSEETWKIMSSYKFIISPHGNGIDCHRTWEALVLGCIPIMKSSPLDPMFEGLPVLIVNEWSEITQELMDSFVPNYLEIEKLKLDYWSKKFKESINYLQNY